MKKYTLGKNYRPGTAKHKRTKKFSSGRFSRKEFIEPDPYCPTKRTLKALKKTRLNQNTENLLDFDSDGF